MYFTPSKVLQIQLHVPLHSHVVEKQLHCTALESPGGHQSRGSDSFGVWKPFAYTSFLENGIEKLGFNLSLHFDPPQCLGF